MARIRSAKTYGEFRSPGQPMAAVPTRAVLASAIPRWTEDLFPIGLD